jgi:hypothetical protein
MSERSRPEPLAAGEPAVARRVKVAGDLFHGRVPDDAVYVGRQVPRFRRSPFANPHRVGRRCECGLDHDAAAAVAAYERYLDARPELVEAAVRELAGRDLACWCKPELPCHADVLLARIAAAPRPGHGCSPGRTDIG